MKIRIITDSASDLNTDIPENVTVLPMTIRFDETEYLDGVTITHEEFYEKLVESDTLPVTSLISPAVFEKAFKDAIDAGETVIAITISSKMSGTYQSALIAASEFTDQVFVVDSWNATTGEQILVRYASKLAETMNSAEEIVSILNEKKNKLHSIALLNTLEYVKKGGRISSAAALVGQMFSIKVVGGTKDGELVLFGKARGSKNANNLLMKEIQKTDGIDFDMPACAGYAGLSDSYLKKYLKDSKAIYEGHEDIIRECSIGATIGTHLGPGAIVVSFFSK